jgi:raffinose/stachyose/melibiose transport system substrate-binding protein
MLRNIHAAIRLASAGAALAGALALSAPASAVELNVWMSGGNPSLDDLVSKFEEANPDITVKMTTFASEDYKTQLRVAVAAGNIPDVYTTNEGFTFFEYVDRGAAMDLTDIAAAKGWKDKVFPEFLAADSRDGHVWGIPYATVHYWQAIFYNKDFFDQNKIAIPTTIDELVQTADQVRKAGKSPVSFGDVAGWPAILLLGDLFMQQVDPTYVDKINSGAIKWTDSEPAKKAFAAIAEMGQKGVFSPGFLTVDHQAAIQGWIGGKSAMLYNGTWWPNANGGSDEVGFTIGVMPLPKIEAGMTLKGTQFWGASPLVIGSHVSGDVKDAAVKFVDFLIGEDAQIINGTGMGAVTSNPQANTRLKLFDYFNAPAFTDQASLPKTGYFDHAFPIPVIEVIKVQLQKLMQGETSVDDALAVVEAEQAKHRS